MNDEHPGTLSTNPLDSQMVARAAIASWFGSALEYYDFFIYGTAAALVFGKIFFSGSDSATGTLIALATFGVGYVARPVGALILGHVGDRFGRKRVLIITLLLMGWSTFLIGCLPTYEQVGIASPIMLVILRLCQGFSASSEAVSANALILEHAPDERRAFYSSFTLSGTQAGLILASAVFLPISQLPEEQLLSWGWRVPFWLSLVVVAVGYIVRRKVSEALVYAPDAQEGACTIPLALLLRQSKRKVLRVALCALVSTLSTVFGIYALSYAVQTIGIDRTLMLLMAILSNVVALVAIPLWAMLSDRIGRRPVFIVGTLICSVLIFPFLWAIASANVLMIFVFGVLMAGVAYSAPNAVWPAFYAEMFDYRVRLTGTAVGTQIGFALAGIAPAIASLMQTNGSHSWIWVACLTAGVLFVAAASAWTASETYDVPAAMLTTKRTKDG